MDLSLDCLVCLEHFDAAGHRPFICKACLNSVCEPCCGRLPACPTCRVAADFGPNRSLIELLERSRRVEPTRGPAAAAAAGAQSDHEALTERMREMFPDLDLYVIRCEVARHGDRAAVVDALLREQSRATAALPRAPPAPPMTRAAAAVAVPLHVVAPTDGSMRTRTILDPHETYLRGRGGLWSADSVSPAMQRRGRGANPCPGRGSQPIAAAHSAAPRVACGADYGFRGGLPGRGGWEHPRESHPRGCKLFVSNLPFDCDWRSLKATFQQVGDVQWAEMITDPEGRSRGMATVTFKNPDDARRAIDEFDGIAMAGRPMNVRFDRGDGHPPTAARGSTPMRGGLERGGRGYPHGMRGLASRGGGGRGTEAPSPSFRSRHMQPVRPSGFNGSVDWDLGSPVTRRVDNRQFVDWDDFSYDSGP